MPGERTPTKAELDIKLGMNTDKPTYAQIGALLRCSSRRVGALTAAGHLTKGADIRRIVGEWVEYQVGLARAGARRG